VHKVFQAFQAYKMLFIFHDLRKGAIEYDEVDWNKGKTNRKSIHINITHNIEQHELYEFLKMAKQVAQRKNVVIHSGSNVRPGEYSPCGCSDNYNDDVCDYHSSRGEFMGINVGDCLCCNDLNILCHYHYCIDNHKTCAHKTCIIEEHQLYGCDCYFNCKKY
jgi:hypothetical protein